jgi:hypothetical protein
MYDYQTRLERFTTEKRSSLFSLISRLKVLITLNEDNAHLILAEAVINSRPSGKVSQ